MRLREIINLARGFRFLRVFVAVIQTELRVLEDFAVTLSRLKLLSLTKDCLLGLDQKLSQSHLLISSVRRRT